MARKTLFDDESREVDPIRIVKLLRRAALFCTVIIAILFLIGCYLLSCKAFSDFAKINTSICYGAPEYAKHITGGVVTLIVLCALLYGTQEMIFDITPMRNLDQSKEILEEVKRIQDESEEEARKTTDNLRKSKDLLDEIEGGNDSGADWWKNGDKVPE